MLTRAMLVVTLLILSLTAASQSLAQRCVPGSLTEQTVKEYPVIIIGKVIARDESDAMGGGFALTDWGKNITRVVKSWKGPDKGERIAIHRNERWGDALSEGSDYLIFAEHDDDDDPDSPLIAPLCSHTKSLDKAKRLVKGLEKYFSRQSQ